MPKALRSSTTFSRRSAWPIFALLVVTAVLTPAAECKNRTVVATWGTALAYEPWSTNPVPISRTQVFETEIAQVVHTAYGDPLYLSTAGDVYASTGAYFASLQTPPTQLEPLQERWDRTMQNLAELRNASIFSGKAVAIGYAFSTSMSQVWFLSDSGALYAKRTPIAQPLDIYALTNAVSSPTELYNTSTMTNAPTQFRTLLQRADGPIAVSSTGQIYLATSYSSPDRFSTATNTTLPRAQFGEAAQLPLLNKPSSFPFLIDYVGGVGVAVIENVIYIWGSSNRNANYTGFVGTPRRFQLGNLVAQPASKWTHVAISSGPALFVSSSGAAYLVGGYPSYQDPRESSELSALIRSFDASSSDGLVQLASSGVAFNMLFMDGSVWAWIAAATDSAIPIRTVGYEIPSGVAGPWPVSLGRGVVPSNYIIYQLSVRNDYAPIIIALSKPRNIVDDQFEPIEPISSRASDRPLVIWQASQSPSLTPAADFAEAIYNFSMGAPGLNKLYKYSLSNSHVLLLTTDGTVMYTGQAQGTGPIVGDIGLLDGFLTLDASFGVIKDITTNDQDSGILLSDGTIQTWGTETDARMRRKKDSMTKRQVMAPVASATTLLNPYDYIFVQNFTASSGTFLSVHGYLKMMAGVTSNGVLEIFGSVDDLEGQTLPILQTACDNLRHSGAIKFFSFKQNGFVSIISSDSAVLTLVESLYTRTGTGSWNDTVVLHTVIPTNATLLESLIQLECRELFCFLVASNNIYGYGTISEGFVGFGNTGIFDAPQPITLKGFPRQGITKVAFMDQTLYILYDDGSLYAACKFDVLSLCKDNEYLAPILPNYSILDIWSSSTHNQVDFHAAIVSPTPRTTQRDVSTEPFLHLTFGPGSLANRYRSTPIGTSSNNVWMMSQDHPIQSATVEQINFDGISGFLIDGQFNGTETLRAIRFGSIAPSQGPSAISTFPSYLPRAGFTQDLIKIVPILGDFLYFYRDCSILPLHHSDGDSFASPYINAQDVVNDAGYNFSFVYKTEMFNDYPVSLVASTCRDRSETIVDAQCSAISADINVGPDFWCVQRSASNELFVMAYYLALGVHPCTFGQFGNSDRCYANSTLVFPSRYTYEAKLNFSDSESFAGHSIGQVSLGTRHGLIVSNLGYISTWGLNDRGQLGLPAQNFADSITLVNVNFTALQVIAFGHSSLAATATEIYAWGDNTLGQLGRTLNAKALPWTSEPAPVVVPVGPFSDIKCSLYNCYVLYPDGRLYSWGMSRYGSLGRSPGARGVMYDAAPALASYLNFPGPARRIVQIITSTFASSVIVRAELVPLSGSPPPSAACRGNPPAAGFICLDGTWTLTGDLTVTPGSPVTFPSTTVITGNLTVQPGSTVVVTVAPGFGDNDRPILNVTGCFVLQGDLQVTIDPETWKSLKGSLNGREIFLVESSCSILDGSRDQEVNAPKDCRKVKGALTQVAHPDGRFGLVSSLEVSSSRCNVWWIVLVSVIGGVLVIVAIIAVLYTVHRKKVFGGGVPPTPRK